MDWIQKNPLLNIKIDIKDLLQPFLIRKIQFIQPPYMYISVRPSCPIFGQNHIWCFYSLHLKPFWKIPSSFRNIAIFWKLHNSSEHYKYLIFYFDTFFFSKTSWFCVNHSEHVILYVISYHIIKTHICNLVLCQPWILWFAN